MSGVPEMVGVGADNNEGLLEVAETSGVPEIAGVGADNNEGLLEVADMAGLPENDVGIDNDEGRLEVVEVIGGTVWASEGLRVIVEIAGVGEVLGSCATTTTAVKII
jgi:hypothetical protein